MRKKVSCHIITYNQKDFISQCIDGVLMQKTTFPFEIIIGDDNSTDGTREILMHYAEKYPEIIKLNLRRVRGKGIPGKDNFVTTLAMCHGEYISLCDGDDYWTDPLKLQKQVDFLEANQDFNICFHRANLLVNHNFILHEVPVPYDEVPFDYITLLQNFNFITAASILFRNTEKNILPSWFNSLPFGDLGLYKIVSEGKKIACINEVMSVYRIHDAGVFSGLNQIETELKYLNFYKNFYSHLNVDEKKVISSKIKKSLYRISQIKYQNATVSKIYYVLDLIKYLKYL